MSPFGVGVHLAWNGVCAGTPVTPPLIPPSRYTGALSLRDSSPLRARSYVDVTLWRCLLLDVILLHCLLLDVTLLHGLLLFGGLSRRLRKRLTRGRL